jgi:GNAT superfamily N-acetyltransferase
MTDLSFYTDAWEEPDGSRMGIRPLRPDDEPGLLALHDNLSVENLRPPSSCAADVSSRDCLLKLSRLDSAQDVGFVAELKDSRGESHLLGVCRYFFNPETRSAELGLEVIKAWQGKGLSGSLLKPLIAVARERGIRQLITGAQAPMMSIVTGFLFQGGVEGSVGTVKVVRNLERGINLREFDPVCIDKADVRFLVSSMYTGEVGKEEIKDFFLDVDPAFAVQCLDKLFHSSDEDIRSNAVELLVYLKGPESLPWIEECLNDEDLGFRCAGCSFLAELDCPEAVSRLIRCLREDPSDGVRYSAVNALERCGDMSVIATLREAAENDQGTDYEGRLISDAALEAIERITERNR